MARRDATHRRLEFSTMVFRELRVPLKKYVGIRGVPVHQAGILGTDV